MPVTPKIIIVHHTASPRDTTTAKAVDNFHKAKNWGSAQHPVYATKSSLGYYITYHRFITADGAVTKCRQDSEIGWHAGDMNNIALGVCLTGWFDSGHDTVPTAAQVASLKAILLEWTQKYNIPISNIYPHRAFAQKSCYGYNLDDNWARNLLINNPKGQTMFHQITGTTGVWAYFEGKWLFVADEKSWKKDWPNARLMHISQADFDQFPKAINTIK